MFEKEKGIKICKTIHKKKIGAWGFLLIEENMNLVSHCHVKKKCCEICQFFVNKQPHIFLIVILFLYKKLKIHGDSCFSCFGRKNQCLNLAPFGLAKI